MLFRSQLRAAECRHTLAIHSQVVIKIIRFAFSKPVTSGTFKITASALMTLKSCWLASKSKIKKKKKGLFFSELATHLFIVHLQGKRGSLGRQILRDSWS